MEDSEEIATGFYLTEMFGIKTHTTRAYQLARFLIFYRNHILSHGITMRMETQSITRGKDHHKGHLAVPLLMRLASNLGTRT